MCSCPPLITLHRLHLSIVLDHFGTLPQGDDSAWPAFAGGLVGRQRQLGVLDTRQMLDDLVAIDSPHIDAVQKVSSVHVTAIPLASCGAEMRKLISGQHYPRPLPR